MAGHFIQIMVFSIAVLSSNAQTVNFSKADSLAVSIGNADSITLPELSAKLTSPFEDQALKARAIYTWIAYNISYDCPAYHSPAKRKGDPEIIFKQRKGVCEGYANLFREMCSYANVQCVTINGFARNGSDVYEFEDDPDESNHAWNAVRINGEWHLVDATWGSGFTDRKVKIFTRQFSDTYFFPSPERFLLNHYPEVGAWRLCRTNLSKKFFFKNPVIVEGYLDCKINSFEPQHKMIKARPNAPIRFSFTVDDPDAVRNLLVAIGEGKKELTIEPLLEKQGNKIGFSVQCPKAAGPSSLAIYINHKLSLIYQLEISQH